MSGGRTQTAATSAEEKRRLLAELLKKKAAEPKTYPVSFSQRRFWFLDQLEPGNPVYNIHASIPLPGPVDPAVVERAVNELVRRHESLRTFFRTEDGEPVQAVLPSLTLAVPFLDLSTLEPAVRDAELRRHVAESRRHVFDLSRGPLLHCTLLRLAPGEHLLLRCLHHIVGDGWSNGIFDGELRTLIAAFAAGQPSPLPPLPIQYGDFAVWQREQVSGDALERQLAYWREHLAGAPETLELPTDFARPARQGYEGAVQHHGIPAMALDGLNALTRQEGATLFMTLMAAFSVLLSRYAGQEDVVLGTPIAGRLRPELERLIGFFVNTLAIHVDLHGDPTFRELVRRVRDATLGAYAHQEMPFDKLVEDLGTERSLAHSPLFQVMFSLQSVLARTLEHGPRPGAPAPEEASRSVAAAALGPSAGVEKTMSMFDMSLNAMETPDGLFFNLEYRTDLWKPDTILRMAAQYGILLEKLAGDPDQRISRVPLLIPNERHWLLHKLNDTARPAPAELPAGLAAMVEAAAARHPQAEAVRFGDTSLTYAELNGRANRLARFLRARGVGPETRVGISVERGLEMPVAVLAVLKAGACYVAMDPGYPEERLAYMLADSRIPVLLTLSHLAEKLPAEGAEVVRLDADWERIASEDDGDLGIEADPESLAYVLYTSGSTGRPKGVALPRRALVNLLHWQLAKWEGQPPARTLQFASLSFDVSIQEMLSTWASGGTLVLVDEETRRDADALLELVKREGVSRLFLPFAALQHLAEVAAEREDVGELPIREIVTAGEQLRATPALQKLAAGTGLVLENQYGPTETHVVTSFVMGAEPGAWPALPPIGTPIGNTRVYVLDAHMQPVPLGVYGELYIAGANLARGYVDRPALTAEKFVPDPFAPEPGGRLYRTGDRVRVMADGQVHFLGRADHQVKVRGFRIELGEIEALLQQHPSVSEAVVVVREDVPGDRRVVGYVSPAEGAEARADELRAFLRERVPDFMVPSALVVLERLPLSPNGKVDRKALPAPDHAGVEETYVAPRTPTEEVLAAIWAEVLRVERVGVGDDFFELGGHSLLATRVTSRIRQALEVEVPVRVLFEAPTLGELASRIAAMGRADDDAPPLVPVRRDGPLPLSFAQERLWFVDRLVPGSTAYNLPLVLPVPHAEPAVLERALGELVRRHEALRTSFAPGEDGPVQVIHPAGPFALEVTDLAHVAPEDRAAEVSRLIPRETGRAFDLARGPLFRARLFRAGAEEQLLVLTMHHAVGDGWSWDVLTRELDAVYRAFSRGEPSPLPELAVQYADFAVWQRAYLQGEVLERQLAYWRERLAGAPPVLALPTDRPRPAVETFRGAVTTFVVPRRVAERVRELGRRQGATLFMALVAAFDVLLSRWTGQEDVVLGTPIAGRNRREVEGLVGFFVNNLVLRTDLSGDPSFAEVLGRVREGTLGAWAHQDLPFEKLVDSLKVERSLGHAPLFQVLFNLLNTAASPTAAGAVPEPEEHGPSAPQPRAAKFDLTVEVHEVGGALAVSLEYSTELFEHDTVARLARQFRALLDEVVERPESPVSTFALAAGDERRMLVSEWSGRATEYERDASLPALFAARAAESPSSIAVSAADATLTYAELDTRANQLARRLRALGVREGTRVGLSVERSAEMVVSILAILKAGGAYVPLDASYPAVRLGWMLEDAEVPVLVVGSEVPQALSGFSGTVLSLAASRDAIDAESSDSIEDVQLGGDSLAYVMFTSGSTGRPKGVAVPHRAVARLVRGTDFARFGADEVFLQLAPVAFDASTLEIWGALLNGARLAVFPPEAPTLEALGEAIQTHGVTTLWLTAGLFRQMVEQNIDGLRGVRQLLAGGDVLPVAHCRRVLEALPGTTLINGYGPTENTTFTACHTVRAEDLERASIPIGKPIANTRVYVLDERMQPVPVGVPGELYAGGDGVALGYVGRPELTAERFVPDPFSDDAEARLYRTGDRVRWLADGTLEFLGRLDQQVKVRGFRIETGEIESALSEHPGVREAVVVPGDDPAGGLRLIAYVVSKDSVSKAGASADAGATDSVDADALRGWLRERVPEYMVPSAFVSMEAIPLTANGKVDRRALPAPERPDARVRSAPETETERALAEIWAEVLKLDAVDAEAGFFDLGGHSLLATRIVSRVRQRFDVELPLRALFEAPTVRALAARIDGLRAADGTGAQAAPPIVPVPRDVPLPLSFAQERLWFVERLTDAGPTYNVPFVYPVPSADPAVLERTLREIVDRHEALRTVFREEDGHPVQVILPAGGFRLRVEDLSALADAERQAEAGRIVSEEYNRTFDLETGPLFRALLVRGGEGEQLLVVNSHHVVSDGWSMQVFQRELEAIYHAFERGEPSPLPPLPVQYADYAVWQRNWLQGEVLEEQLAYWKDQLAGAPAMLELPTDRPRPAVQTFNGSTVPVSLPRDVAEKLAGLASAEGATPFMALLAAFNVLLSRYAGQDDVVVGSPIAGRTRGETEGLIGFFVNNLVLRTDLSGNPSFRELLGRVREVTLGAYAHQDVPFEKLVEEVGVERSLSHTPLFQVMFVLQNTGDAPAAATGAATASGDAPAVEADAVDGDADVEGPHRTAKFDLTLNLSESPQGGLTGNVEFNTDLFDRASVRRIARHFRALAAALADAPDAPVAGAVMLPADEAARVGTFSGTEGSASTALVHRLFEARVDAAPDAVALAFGGEEVTYAQLDARANRLARHLRELGVGADVPVALSLPRSPEMVIAMLAVLKAGGAYLPVDPAYPRERRAWMLADSGAPVLVTLSSLVGDLPPTSAALVRVDADADAIAARDAARLAGDVPADALAYVIYTSGSTGTPKGVAVSHRGVANLALAQAEAFGIGAGSRVLQFASPSFDAAVSEVVTALATGARLVLAPQEELMPGAGLSRLLREAGVTVATLPPSVLAAMEETEFPALATVVSAGEALPRDVGRRWAAGRRLIDAYGPTEATVCATLGPVAPDDARPGIGRPMANVRVHVLDAAGRPAGVGVPGELYVGGIGVARGYLGRPGLTAERFVPDPFSPRPGARLYRTGDRGRWRDDGTLEFLGRVDAQVKVRGFRIEPGEVEAALASLDGVRDAVVVVREDAPGDRRLVAYVVGGEGTAPEPAALREQLGERLPHYMVPSAIVPLPALPLTPNGKVDRRALPAPEAPAGAEYVPPRTETERVLAEVYAAVLHAPRVGAGDDFFALGGHSLLAAALVSRIRRELDAELPLRAVFEAPTVRALAARVDAARAEGGVSGAAPPIVPVPRSGPLPLSFAQERLWFVERLAATTGAYNLPVVLPVAQADAAVLERVLAEVVRRHEALRTTFSLVDGSPVQVVHPAGGFRLRVVDVATAADGDEGEALHRAVAEETSRPFDLEAGPLFRAALFRAGAGTQLLAITMHHVVSDGWSVNVLLREVQALYDAFAAGQPSPLPELPVQYADYAVWQREWLQGDVLDAQLAYWRGALAGAPEVLELPTDRPRPAVQTFLGASRTVLLPAALRDRLSALAREEGGTLFMALLAGWSALLGRWSGQDDVVVGSTAAGRTRDETEALIGFFVNNLVLRTDLSGDPSFRDLLRRSRETTLGAYAHQDVPFEKLVDSLKVERALSHTPLFQVMLNVLTAETGATGATAASETEGVEGQGEHAKYDLTLTISDTEAGLAASLNYNVDLFDAGTIRRMLDHLRALLERAAELPDAPLSRVSVLSDGERRTVLDEWNRTTRPEYRRDVCIHRFFEAQAASAPERTALVFGDERITYGELNGRANQLARHLRTLGVGPDRLVGVCMPRTPEMAVSLLAVLKAGGAYVPVDLAYPVERIGWMLEDAQAPVVLTVSEMAERIPLGGSTAAVCVDAEAQRIATYPSTDLEDVPVAPENLAYCIYTSGSTGRPKGVAIEHRNTAILLQWLRDEVSEEERKSVLGSTSISFDVSIAEIFGTLSWGGTLVLVENALSLAALPAGVEVGYASMVPSAAAELLRMGGVPASVRTLNLGGEPLPAALAQGLYALGTVERVGNLYGPTEDTTYSTYSLVETGGAKVTVGRPVANTRAYVLDRHLMPVPIGVPGELYLAGDGVTRGYFNRPSLTAERYVPDPFSAEGGGRMYRVGDLVRYLPSGEIEYLGRIDQQVKVRGFRIETGEIEAALTSLDGVREAAVVAREVAEGDRRLVAYVVADEGAEVDASALRAHLAGRLPEYMVPAAIVPLDALPLTPNGKVDRRALPAPDWSGAGGEHVGPRDEVEAQLVAIWEEVLGVSPIGVHDHFFALGGHSLLAVRMTTLVRERMGVELPLASLFRGDTVAQVAAELRGETGAASELLVPIQPDGDRTPLFLVHGAAGAVLRFMGLGRAIGPDQPVYALRALGLEPGEEPAASVEEMAAAYAAAIRRARPHGPYHVGGWSSGCAVAMEVARQLRAAGEEVPLLLLLDGSTPTLDAGQADQSDLELLTQVAVELGRPLPPQAGAELKKLEGEDRLQRALEWINAAGAVLPAGDTARLRRLVEVLRASLRIWTAYRPAPYDGPALLLQAYDRLAADMAVDPYAADFRLAWASVLPQMQGEVVPGGHYGMLDGENAVALAERIRAAV